MEAFTVIEKRKNARQSLNHLSFQPVEYCVRQVAAGVRGRRLQPPWKLQAAVGASREIFAICSVGDPILTILAPQSLEIVNLRFTFANDFTVLYLQYKCLIKKMHVGARSDELRHPSCSFI